MSQKLAEIPEILEHISRYLGPHDLFSCVQVSSQWHHSFIPSLWHNIDDTTQSWTIVLCHIGDPVARSISLRSAQNKKRATDSGQKKDFAWLTHVFHKYGRHIRNITIQSPTVLEVASMASSPNHGDPGSSILALKSLTLDMKSEPIPFYLMKETRSRVALPPVAVSAPLFPGVVEEKNFLQPATFSHEIQLATIEKGWVLTQHYWNLIFSNPGLQRLVLRKSSRVQWSTHRYYNPLSGPIILQHLREIKGWNINHMPNIWTLLRAAPMVETLSIVRWDKLPDPLPQANLSLRHFSLNNSIDVRDIPDLLAVFPNLSSLSLAAIETPFKFQPQRLADVELGPPPRTDTPFRLVVGPMGHWDGLLRCLPRLPHLTELHFNGHLTDTLATVLMTVCPRLQVFRAKTQHWFLVGHSERPPDPTNDFLVASSDLRVLDSIMNFIHADDMLRQPWACMGLERLRCRIMGIERLTDAEQTIVDRVLVPGPRKEYTADEALAVLKFQRCRAQQLVVYDQLANLTRLKQLDLGFENRNPRRDRDGERYQVDGNMYVRYTAPTFDTLELSLDSGLGHLGALENLEMVGFECINHRIGREELAWMAKNWPRLKLMYGLDKEQLPDLEPNKERTALKEYFQQLRPDVGHGSSFVCV